MPLYIGHSCETEEHEGAALVEVVLFVYSVDDRGEETEDDVKFDAENAVVNAEIVGDGVEFDTENGIVNAGVAEDDEGKVEKLEEEEMREDEENATMLDEREPGVERDDDSDNELELCVKELLRAPEYPRKAKSVPGEACPGFKYVLK